MKNLSIFSVLFLALISFTSCEKQQIMPSNIEVESVEEISDSEISEFGELIIETDDDDFSRISKYDLLLYRRGNFKGVRYSFTMPEGRSKVYANMPPTMNNSISSLRIRNECIVTLFDGANKSGASHKLYPLNGCNASKSIGVMPGGWNDRVSSIEIDCACRR